MTPDPDAAGWTVHLMPVADPIYGSDGKYSRAGIYRLRLALKCLLRGFGLKCVRIGPPPGDPAAVQAHRG